MSERSTILIVDDNPTNLSVLFEYLTAVGFRVLSAESGESALTRVQHAIPDLILLDIMMPGLDGYKTCERLKQIKEVEHVPVIFMTALHDAQSKVRAFNSGGVDYVTKPFQQEEVLARIRTHLRLRDLQRSLQKQLHEREEMIQDLNAYASMVAHELRSPLNTIVGVAEALASSEKLVAPEDHLQMIRFMHQSGIKLSTIVEELLILASVRDAEVELEPILMVEVIENVRSRIAELEQRSDVEIDIPEPLIDAMGQPLWLEEVWLNLILNAIQIGGTPPRIVIAADEPKPGTVRYRIWDNGEGLENPSVDSVFGRKSGGGTGEVAGLGLGLSIARRIVEKMGGEVAVESKVGEGTCLSFTLPGIVRKATEPVG